MWQGCVLLVRLTWRNSRVIQRKYWWQYPKKELKSNGLQNQDLLPGTNPQERALDRVIIPENPFIRHGLLSILGSVYDLLRPARLFIREGRPITKNLCKENFSWDERIPRNIERQWVQWLHRLWRLVSINIPRCCKPQKFGDIKTCSIHKFPNAIKK